jgi:pyrroloquinoline quinone (PQQ) biosynthesis protein C
MEGQVTSTVLHPLAEQLHVHPLRRQLVNHDFFKQVKAAPLTRDQVAIFLGQWWHPLHYFPTFLSRTVAVLPDIVSKCAIARILNQETGDGNPKRAHEVIYVDTMKLAGFTVEQTSQMAPFPETAMLVEGYQTSASARLSALGFVFATEVADLAMVSGIGTAVERVTGMRQLEWVDIHIEQEPDHVEQADQTMLMSFTPQDAAKVMKGAEEMWRLWISFFDRLQDEVFGRAPAAAAQE